MMPENPAALDRENVDSKGHQASKMAITKIIMKTSKNINGRAKIAEASREYLEERRASLRQIKYG